MGKVSNTSASRRQVLYITWSQPAPGVSCFCLLVVQAVEGSHFFTQPVFVPFIHRDDPFGVAFDFATQESHRKAGRFAPEATKLADFLCHLLKQFCYDCLHGLNT